ncbi:MAG: CHAD domain-containing protein [Gammaproteobacteria bacterium]|nr:CHAD domain-containing protein [Gammaproteobacteria bacterium]
MYTPLHQFCMRDAGNADALLIALSEQLQLELRSEAETALNRIYFDSFDWRLYLGGGVLYCKPDGRKKTLIWTKEGGDDAAETLTIGRGMPKFAEDFPPGAMRDALSGLLEMRALIPQVEVKGRVRIFKVLDPEQKTVLRLSIESHASREPGVAEFSELPERIGLLPMRGYAAVLKRAKKILEKDMGLEAVAVGLLPAALTALGRKPADYSAKLEFQFAPEDAAGLVARRIHLNLLDTIERNLPGTCANTDSEFLHDLRVAVRRARSALTQIKGVFNPEAVAAFNPRLAWIGQITGPSRDMDVYLLDYDVYRSTLPQRFQADLDPLHGFLLAHRKRAYREMASKLKSKDFQTFLKEWRRFLDNPPESDDTAGSAALPVKQVADKRIRRIYKRVLAEGSAVNDSSPATAFHELRKNCKKLRYLIEFFQSLYPSAQILPLIKALKALLDNLGAFQDTEVQANKLREFAHQMVKEGEVPADTLLAMGMLVDGLLQRQQEARKDFHNCFNLFAGKENRKELKAIFSGSSRASQQG